MRIKKSQVVIQESQQKFLAQSQESNLSIKKFDTGGDQPHTNTSIVKEDEKLATHASFDNRKIMDTEYITKEE